MSWPEFGTWYLQFVAVAFTVVLLLIMLGGAFGLTKATREKSAVRPPRDAPESRLLDT